MQGGSIMLHRDFLYVEPEEYYSPFSGEWHTMPTESSEDGEKNYLARYSVVGGSELRLYEDLGHKQMEISICGNLVKVTLKKKNNHIVTEDGTVKIVVPKQLTLHLALNEFKTSSISPVLLYDFSDYVEGTPEKGKIGYFDLADTTIGFRFNVDDYNRIICKELREKIIAHLLDYVNLNNLKRIDNVTRVTRFMNEVGDDRNVLEDLLSRIIVEET